MHDIQWNKLKLIQYERRYNNIYKIKKNNFEIEQMHFQELYLYIKENLIYEFQKHHGNQSNEEMLKLLNLAVNEKGMQ